MQTITESMARDAFDRPLAPDVLDRLRRVAEHPTLDTWEDAHGIILNDGMMTLWQACLEIDPFDTPHRGRSVSLAGEVLEEWECIPSARTIDAAIRYATH